MTEKVKFKVSGNLSEQVQRYLAIKIIRFEIKPGERLLEEKITSELGISRGPVREALRTLARYRLVELIPRRGARVTEVTRQNTEWLLEVIVELLIILVRRWVLHCDEATRESLDKVSRKIRSCADEKDFFGYFDAVFEYFAIILEASNNPVLGEILQDLIPGFLRVAFASYYPDNQNLDKNTSIYHELGKCSEKRDADKAVMIVREYFDTAREKVLAAIDRWADLKESGEESLF